MATVKIRQKMPETNSSSSHSLSICENDPSSPQIINLKFDNTGKKVIIPDCPTGDFGWGEEIYYDPGVKACYTMACICGLYSGKKLLKAKEMFEKVIKDYTGAEEVIYEWVGTRKPTIKNITTLAPTVDHQSISDMYMKISETEDSMRDFIFSNRSWLVIDGDGIPPLNVLGISCPGITKYNVQIIFHIPFNGSNEFIIKYHEWPGGEKIREDIENFGSNLQYNPRKKEFEKVFYFANNEEVWNLSVPIFEEGEIRFYDDNRLYELNKDNEEYIRGYKGKIAIESNLPYETVKFEIIGNDNL